MILAAAITVMFFAPVAATVLANVTGIRAFA